LKLVVKLLNQKSKAPLVAAIIVLTLQLKKRMSDKIVGFNEKCYELLKLVHEGKITTYKEILRALNSKAWRAVGSAMAENKNLFVIPCHRVARSDGVIGQCALGTDKK